MHWNTLGAFVRFSLCTFRHIALSSESFKQFNGIQTHARVHRWHSLFSCSFKMSLRGKSYHFLAVMVHNLLWPMDRPAMLVFFFFVFLFFAQWRCLNLTDWRTNNSTDVYSSWKRNLQWNQGKYFWCSGPPFFLEYFLMLSFLWCFD